MRPAARDGADTLRGPGVLQAARCAACSTPGDTCARRRRGTGITPVPLRLRARRPPRINDDAGADYSAPASSLISPGCAYLFGCGVTRR